MTKALDAAGAAELARAMAEVRRLQDVCRLHWRTIEDANDRAEKAEQEAATLRRQLEEADAVVWGGPEVSWSWYVEACDRHHARSPSSSPRGMAENGAPDVQPVSRDGK